MHEYTAQHISAATRSDHHLQSIPEVEGIPQKLRERRQWVCWKYAVRGGRPTKVPVDAWTGNLARTDAPDTWGTLEIALRRIATIGTRESLAGVGFVISEDDPFVGTDYDGCRDTKTGEVDPTVAAEIAALGGYAEVSPSGSGVKVIVEATKPGPRCRNAKLGVEVYDRRRFFTVTGDVLEGHGEIGPSQDAVDAVYARAFPEPEEGPTTRPKPGVVVLDDRRLLKKARNWRRGKGKHFRRLYDDGDASGYGSRSEADFALLRFLAFATGGDAGRMEALFRRSALFRPEKGADYVGRSVRNLLTDYRGDFYDPKKRAGEAEEVLSGGFWEAVYASPWKGIGGPTDHNVLIALAMEAMERGVPKGRGASVRVRREDLARLAGTSAPTVSASLGRLEEAGWVERHRDRRRKAQEIVLKIPADAPSDFLTRYSHGVSIEHCELPSEKSARRIGQLLRLRWGRSQFAAVSRVGKSSGLLAHYLFAAGKGGLSVAYLAEIVGRRRDNVRSNLRRLASAGLAEETGTDRYTLVAGFWQRLEQELEDSGIATSERLQTQREHRVVDAVAYWREQPKPEDDEPPIEDAPNSTGDLLEVPKNLHPVDGEIGDLERRGDLDDHERRFFDMEFDAQEVNSRTGRPLTRGAPEPEVEGSHGERREVV